MPKRFVIYGAGAIGGVIGALLRRAGHDVALIARGAHGEAIRERGLRLETPDETVTFDFEVASHPGELRYRDGDVVVLGMKTQDTAAALGALAAAAPPGIVVACAQNGIENERLALRHFAQVYGICVVLPASHLEPGVVRVHSAPVRGALGIGRYPRGEEGIAGDIAAAFCAAGFESSPHPDVMRVKYAKLLSNLGNAVEVVCGRSEQAHEVFELAQAEGRACLRAAGIDADEARLAAYHEVITVRPVASGRWPGSSSLQSLERRTGTIEADYLNGEIVLVGRGHGVPVPVNALLQRLANQFAREQRPPGSMQAAEFLAAAGAAPRAPGAQHT
ncbi:MAG TPA: 2-dehydropantoate 2-reductase [Streptosporangiaceae bacterium]|nr:2-dehydropantoate 2-reductase [Streptosporangiaceae bacterium]